MPGLGNSKNDYKALAELLTKEELTTEIASVNRVDWLREWWISTTGGGH